MLLSKNDNNYNRLMLVFEILQCLAKQPIRRTALIAQMQDFLEEQGQSLEGTDQRIDRIIRQLRDCGFEIRSAPNRPYELVESGFPIILSPEQQETLSMAAQILSSMGFSVQANQLLRIGKITELTQPSQFKVNFSPPVDYSEANLEAIVSTLQQRFQQRRRYTIRYRSSQGQERLWDLDRSELRLHNGVLYLFAFVPDLRHRHDLVEKNMIYRVDRILSIGPASDVPWGRLNFPFLIVRYRMSGPLATYQPRRDRETVIDRPDHKNYVDIESREDYIFWLRQRLLQYGKNALLLSPNWLVKDMLQELWQAYSMYDLK